jgi:hypothetical protein
MKHIPQNKAALEKAFALDYRIVSVHKQLSHSGNSTYRAAMVTATLQTFMI